MTVSIILPIYNVEQYIEACVRSIAAQHFTDYELIAVDDCGQDVSMQLFEETVENTGMPSEKVHVIHHECNKGLSGARNTGIQASSGKYLFFLDSDDMLTPDCLEKLVGHSTHDGKDVEMVVGNFCYEGAVMNSQRIETRQEYLGQKGYIRAYCKSQIYSMAWNRLVLREFIVNNKLYFEEGLIHEDTLWNFQLLPLIKSVTIVHDVTYRYRVRGNSLQTGHDFEKHFRADSYIVGRMAEIMFALRTLKYNKYVYNFIEQEKWRHLNDCYLSGNMHLVRQLYTICREKPHYAPWKAILLFGYHEGILRKIIKRDRHYAMSFEKGLAYFSKLPEFL